MIASRKNPGRWLAVMPAMIWIPALAVHQAAAQPASTGPATGGQPNFLFILVDDMRWDVMSCAGHPFVRTPNIDRIAASGVRFANAFVTTSLCSPSRASFLTGVQAFRHGVRVNGETDPDPSVPTFPQLLRKAGYETAFIGKWHMRPGAEPRPGFDYWLSFAGQGEYRDPELNENGRDLRVKGYMTDILTDHAVRWLQRKRDRPFCLCLSHKAMHADFIPAERHRHLYRPSDLREPPSYRDDLSGKAAWMREVQIRGGRLKRPLPEGGIPDAVPPGSWDPDADMNRKWLDYHRTLPAVDDSVGMVLDTLRQTGVDGQTVIIFAGDNGFFLGEHRRTDKRLCYEESIRIPLLVSGPGVARAPRAAAEMVLNVDVAPTILDLAGVDMPSSMQGRSLAPLLAGKKSDWRDAFFYVYYREDWLPGLPTMIALRTDEWKYIRYPEIEDIDELYNLKRDPHEMRNLAGDSAAETQRKQMRDRLDRWWQEAR